MSGDDHRLPVTEEELVALFAPHRVDAAQFRARIAAKVAARRGAPPAAPGETPGSSFLRRAAGLLPPEFGVTASANKLGSAQGLTFALALPFLVLASSVATLFTGVRSMRRSARDAAPPILDQPRHLDRAIVGRWLAGAGAGSVAMILAAIVAVALGGHWAPDILLVCTVVSMSAMTAVLHRMSRAGVLMRDLVARFAVTLLCGPMSLFVSANFFIQADRWPVLPFAVASLVLVVGVLVAYAVASERTGWRKAREIVVLVLMGAWLAPSTSTESTPLALSTSFERSDASIYSSEEWEAQADVIEALRATGCALPDLSRVEARIDAALLSYAGAPDWVWTSAARIGVMTPERWTMLASDRSESERMRHLFADRGDLHLSDSSLHLLPMALAVHPPSAEEREALVERVRFSWPRPDDERALDDAANYARWFHWLGRDDEVAARADDIHRILVRHWVAHPDFLGKGGGFTSFTDINSSFGDSTLRAIELIAAVGAPPEIDLERVHGFLQRDALDLTRFLDSADYLHTPSRAALLRLEREIGLPPRSWFERLLDQRAWIAAVLLVLLCFFAIASAPAAPSGGGAQPRKRRA